MKFHKKVFYPSYSSGTIKPIGLCRWYGRRLIAINMCGSSWFLLGAVIKCTQSLCAHNTETSKVISRTDPMIPALKQDAEEGAFVVFKTLPATGILQM